MPPRKRKKYKTISPTFTGHEVVAIQKIAKEEGRTFTNLVTRVMREYLAKQSHEPLDDILNGSGS